mmetsp:Transcript_27660/g.57036  ORF Transcript_27660/g.57036 Transcript_27660/m.57036 type:complete len:90 (-) Transcript_27660:328-597(-)
MSPRKSDGIPYSIDPRPMLAIRSETPASLGAHSRPMKYKFSITQKAVKTSEALRAHPVARQVTWMNVWSKRRAVQSVEWRKLRVARSKW